MTFLSNQISSLLFLLIVFQIISHPIVIFLGRIYGFLVILYDAFVKQFDGMSVDENPSKTGIFCKCISGINYTTLTMNILCTNYNHKWLILVLFQNINQITLHRIKPTLIGFIQFVGTLFRDENLAETVMEHNQFLTSRLTLTILSYLIGIMHSVSIESIELNVFNLTTFGFVISVNVLDQLVIYRKKMRTQRLLENLNNIINSFDLDE